MQRFISEDPIGFAGGVNLYLYVGGNPISFSDPLGLLLGATLGGLQQGVTLDQAVQVGQMGNAAAVAGLSGGAATAAAGAVAIPAGDALLTRLLDTPLRDLVITGLQLIKTLGGDVEGIAPKLPSLPTQSPNAVVRTLNQIKKQSCTPSSIPGAPPNF